MTLLSPLVSYDYEMTEEGKARRMKDQGEEMVRKDCSKGHRG